MDSLFWLIGLGISTFVATNIDDLFILISFFSNPSFTNRQIVMGQLLGITTLVAVSAFSYFLKMVVPASWIGLSGLLPIAIGLKNLRQKTVGQKEDATTASADDDKRQKRISSNILFVAFMTIANGGDNIGIYAPFFASLSLIQILVVVLIFLALTCLWCVASYYLVNNRFIGDQIAKYGHRLLPWILIGLGVFILIKNKAYLILS